MAAHKQELLKELWLGGKAGTLSAQQEARAWGLRSAWQEEHGDTTYGMNTWIASKVWKIKEEKKRQEHPTPEALRQLFEKIDTPASAFKSSTDRSKIVEKPSQNR